MRFAINLPAVATAFSDAAVTPRARCVEVRPDDDQRQSRRLVRVARLRRREDMRCTVKGATAGPSPTRSRAPGATRATRATMAKRSARLPLLQRASAIAGPPALEYSATKPCSDSRRVSAGRSASMRGSHVARSRALSACHWSSPAWRMLTLPAPAAKPSHHAAAGLPARRRIATHAEAASFEPKVFMACQNAPELGGIPRRGRCRRWWLVMAGQRVLAVIASLTE